MIPFNEVNNLFWFTFRGSVYQKLPNLNGSNCYKFGIGYAYLKPSTKVLPIERVEMKGRVNPAAKKRAMIVLSDDGSWRYGESPV